MSDEKKATSLLEQLRQPGEPEKSVEDIEWGENQQENKKGNFPTEWEPNFVKKHKEYKEKHKSHQIWGKAGIKSILPKTPLIFFCHSKKIGQLKMEEPWNSRISIKALIEHYFSSLPVVTAMCLILLMTSGIFAPLLIVYITVTIGLLLYAARFKQQQIFRENTRDDLHRRKLAMLSASSFPLALIVSLISISDFMPEVREPWIISLSVICVASCIAEDVFATIDALHTTIAKGSAEQ